MSFGPSVAPVILASGAPACTSQLAGRPVDPVATLPLCEPENGGITLPDGFFATVVADQIGEVRHLAVAANGDIYVAVRNSPDARGAKQKFIICGLVASHESA